MGICGEERHLPLGVAAIGTMRLRFDKLSDREAIGGVVNNSVLAHLSCSPVSREAELYLGGPPRAPVANASVAAADKAVL
jgi:hypothetical protein